MLVKLLAIDDPDTLSFIRSELSLEDVEVLTANNASAATELFCRARPRIVLLGLNDHKGDLAPLEQLVAIDPLVEVICMAEEYSVEAAIEAIRRGARDYIAKPLDAATLRSRIATLVSEARQRQHAELVRRETLTSFQWEGIVGSSPLMLDVFAKIRRIAPHFRTVLVTGATGTGKELVAQAIHHLSPVASKPLVVCNCAALVETLLESELFGYVKGAFTGATQDKVGLFEHANGGALFLDEVGELSLAGQVKLLRVMQHQEVQRVGAPGVRKVEVRVIAATNHDLRALIQEKKFREDLYYRLSMVEITIPKLMERKEDLPLLQRHFLEKFAAQYKKPILGVTRRAQILLARYDWPGNVRELENAIGQACMMAEGEVIDVGDLPLHLREQSPSSPSGSLISFKELQRRHLLRVLDSVQGNRNRAAEILGISRSTLYNLLAKLQSETGRTIA